MLLPSVLGFALCFVCLAATTWAWFVVSVTSGANTIQTASFGVEMTVNGNPVAADANGSYTIAAGTHTIKLRATGNATKGFVVVEVAQQTSGVVLMMAGTGVSPSSATPDTTAAGTYCTPQLFVDGVPQVATFTLKTEGAITLTPCWGEQEDYSNLSDKSVISATLVASDESQLTNEEEAPAAENQQEEEQENQQQEEENPSDENNPPDDPENNGEGENPSTDTPTEGEQGDEQQPSEPSTPTEGEGEQPDVSGETTGGDIGDDTATGGETPTNTTTPAGGDVPTEPVVTTDPTDPTAQSEGGAPADPAPIE